MEPYLGRPSLVRLVMSGELDVAAAPRLAAAVRVLVGMASEPGAPRRLTYLDLNGVTFLDSHGLRALLLTREEVRAAGWRVAVVGATGQVSWLLQLARARARLGVAAAVGRPGSTYPLLPARARPHAAARGGPAAGAA